MIHNTAVSLARLLTAALLMTLFGCVGIPGNEVFTANSGKYRVTFSCEGAVLVETPCKIEVGEDSPREAIPVRFGRQPTRYAHLLKEAIEKALESDQSRFRSDPSDVGLLRGLALDKCHPAVEHWGDVYQLCVPADSSSSVVLFVRQVCDFCYFEPIILKKQATQRAGSTFGDSRAATVQPERLEVTVTWEPCGKTGIATLQGQLAVPAEAETPRLSQLVTTHSISGLGGAARDCFVDAGQRVCTASTRDLLTFKAIVVEGSDALQYIYAPMVRDVPVGKWSNLLPPRYVSANRSVAYQIIHNLKHTQLEAPKTAPRLRFKIDCYHDLRWTPQAQ